MLWNNPQKFKDSKETHNCMGVPLWALQMPEPWKKIVIGPKHSIEYPKIPQRFSMFMTGESTRALKPYLLIEDNTGKEYSILLAMTTGHYVGGKTISINLRHGDKTSHNRPGVFPLNNLKPPIKSKSVLEPTSPITLPLDGDNNGNTIYYRCTR